MNCFFKTMIMKHLYWMVAAVALLSACAGGPGGNRKESAAPEYYDDLKYRDSVLLAEGLIHYGQDTGSRGFDDMHYVFVADDSEKAAESERALDEFRQKIDGMSPEERAFMAYLFNDYADLATMSEYVYKDAETALPEGWTDLGEEDPELSEIIVKYSASGAIPTGLKCSLMAKGDRRALVFAGTDFPSKWSDISQLMNFVADAYEDVDGALNDGASQVVQAGRLVDELLDKGYVSKDNLEFAGHSLGGRLASEMAVRYGCPAVVFNAAGVSPATYERYEKARTSAGEDWRGCIVDVTAANDPLTCAQKYMSGSTDPFVSAAADALSVDSETMDGIISLGLGVIGAAADEVSGGSEALSAVKDLSDRYGAVVESLYERDYRALGAMMPIRENMGGHGIKELAAALRARAGFCESASTR